MSKRDVELETSSTEEEDEPPSLMGNLRTSLKWDLGRKQLHLGESHGPLRRPSCIFAIALLRWMS